MSRGRAVRAQAAMDVRLTWRNGEQLLLTIGIPVLLLLFFTSVDVLPLDDVVDDRIDFLAPGVLALAVMSTAFTGLAISTGFERGYLVLKRLGATPLGRRGLVAARTIAVGVTQAIQVAVLVALSLALGWRPEAGWAPAVAAVALATIAFAGLGLLLAGTLPALTVLAAANGLWLVLLLLGGMVVPLSELPGALRAVGEVLPAAALADVLLGALTDGTDVAARSWWVLAAWAVVTPLAASRWFRWEP